MSVQAAAGLELHVARSLAVLAEYKLTHSRQDVGIAEGSAQTALRTHHFVAGLALRLGGSPSSRENRLLTRLATPGD